MNRLRTSMSSLISHHERPLKSRALDAVEGILLVCAGLALLGFTITVFLDVASRLLGHPILWLQEATLIAFVWGVFLGGAVAQRRSEHFVLTSLGHSAGPTRRKVVESISAAILTLIGLVLTIFGYLNFQNGFGNQLPVTGLPLAVLTGSIPIFGLLVVLFTVERVTLGWRRGFPAPDRDIASEQQELGAAI